MPSPSGHSSPSRDYIFAAPSTPPFTTPPRPPPSTHHHPLHPLHAPSSRACPRLIPRLYRLYRSSALPYRPLRH
ncbi:hypothetical protein BS50DRAFT_346988 [Corynespora cassiicola Philippines]|uniref:Uncharacterized protein n=1 Tax=Corynespora cassiicola Philippines TaxID=1448308 RepID=A0A2T2NQM1_CORCC|nr:hypothetical protein BS50DRAFT_346988 [Corynespora cassiicola Philippines]